jgi:large subunit ribosomal protein L22
MEKRTASVKIKDIAQSPLKLRLVVDMVRGKDLVKALTLMKFVNKKGAKIVYKALESVAANAQDRHQIAKEDLQVIEARVDEGKTRKTGRFASRGRFAKILKRRSHLILVVAEK